MHAQRRIGADDMELSPWGSPVHEQVSTGGEAELLQVERADHGTYSGSVTVPVAS